MLRRTKIVATLGPATTSEEAIAAIVKAGVDVVRLNFSHGSAEEHRTRAERVRQAAKKQGRVVAVMADLQGPKLRIARFKDGKVELKEGQTFTLDAALDPNSGDENQVGLDYAELVDDVTVGDVLVLDDGRLEAKITAIDGTRIETRVLNGGPLSNNKGLNKKGGGLSAAALTDKDREDLVSAVSIDVDYLAVSFVRSAADLIETRNLLDEEGSNAGIVAKIERAELVHDIEELDAVIKASDAVMVARGDLAVEIGDAELVAEQKYLIHRARELNRVVITATQMMESMISSPMPTRAEVSDIANAVIDYTDAVMLSGESAIGNYPAEAIAAMARISKGAEKSFATHQPDRRSEHHVGRIDEGIAMAAMYAANHVRRVKAIICMSETGATPLMMSRIKSPLPIFAFSRSSRTQAKTCLYKGVHAIPFDAADHDAGEVNQHVVDELRQRGVLEDGDRVIITKGDYANAQGGTNSMKIVNVGDNIR